MSRKVLVDRIVLAGALGAAAILCSPVARAEDAPKKKLSPACATAYKAYKNAQNAQTAGHMREAFSSLQECEAAACANLSQQCTAKLAKLTSEMPSVIPLCTDENGAPRVDVEVKMDGALLTSQLDGKGIPVEPGVHEFTFGTSSGVFATQKLMIVEGQRNRAISVSMRGPDKPAAAKTDAPAAAPADKPSDAPADKAASSDKDTAPDKTSSAPKDATSDTSASPEEMHLRRLGPSPFAWAAGGVGVAAIAAGGLLTYWGNKDNSSLSTCKPGCDPSVKTHIQTLYIASDISFGVGALAAGVAIWLFATPRYAAEQPKTATTHPKTATVRFDVAPSPTGAYAGVSGTFF